MEPFSQAIPWGTLAVNIAGCFVIGFFGTLTLHGTRYPMPETARVFVMAGVCGGVCGSFTPPSSPSDFFLLSTNALVDTASHLRIHIY